ncbi:MAG: hypothetical protein AAFY11_14120, partial [Cyanobacteria bacterium J06641_5]
MLEGLGFGTAGFEGSDRGVHVGEDSGDRALFLKLRNSSGGIMYVISIECWHSRTGAKDLAPVR